MTAELDLAGLKAMLAEATPGDWKAEPADMFGDHNIVLADDTEDRRAIAAVVSNLRDPKEVAANARLFAAAKASLPKLIQRIEELEEALRQIAAEPPHCNLPSVCQSIARVALTPNEGR